MAKKDEEEPEAESPEKKAKDKEEDKALQKAVEEVTEINRKIDEVYDNKVQQLQMKKKLIPLDEKAEEDHAARILMLKEKYADLKSKISQVRKSGKDPFIPDLMTKSIPAKIRMADVTREKRDFDQVEIMIKNAAAELEEVKNEKSMDVKKEIEARLKESLRKETGKVEDGEED